MHYHLLTHLPLLAGAAAILLIVVLSILIAAIPLAASRRIKANASRQQLSTESERAFLQSGSYDILEDWLADNRARLQIFKPSGLAPSEEQMKANSASRGDSDWN